MILLAVYGVLVWYLAMRWRRRWYGFASVAVLSLLLWLTTPLIRMLSPDWHGMTVLIGGESLLLALGGLFICLLPRTPRGTAYCRQCWYEFKGLERDETGNLVCPECGAPARPTNLVERPPPRAEKRVSAAHDAVEHAEDEHSDRQAGDEKPSQG